MLTGVFSRQGILRKNLVNANLSRRATEQNPHGLTKSPVPGGILNKPSRSSDTEQQANCRCAIYFAVISLRHV